MSRTRTPWIVCAATVVAGSLALAPPASGAIDDLDAERAGGGTPVLSATPAAQIQSVDEVIRQLDSPDATERAMAACRLGRMDAEVVGRARDRLLELLSDGTEVDGSVCREGPDRWSPRRREPSSPGREAVIALEELGSGVIDPVVGVLQGQDAAGRENAALALGLVESPRAVDPLVRALSDDHVAAVRARAAWALGMIEDPGAVEALVAAIEDEDPRVRKQAIWALSMVVRSGGFDRVDRNELADALRRALLRDP